MKNLKTIIGLAAMALCLGFASCSSDDDALSYSTAAVSNSELMTILKDKGYQFNEQGNLLLDDKATSTTSLDLSGTKISQKALAELNILPNLTDVNLSNNGYGPVFHVDSLPSQIKGLDLTGNQLYYFPGLVDIKTQENGDETVTVLHSLSKLYLPECAKYNCNELVVFYQNASNADMKIEDNAGKLSTYTTLREVPDAQWRARLQKLYPSMFDGDKIDIAKRLVKPDECSQNMTTVDVENRTMTVGNIEGFQYIVQNKGYNGAMLYMLTDDKCEISYFPIPSCAFTLQLTNISTPNNFDASNLKNLCYVEMDHNEGLKLFDLSNSKTFGKGSNTEFIDNINICGCDNLEEVRFPEDINTVSVIAFVACPKLKSLDLKKFEDVSIIQLGGLTSLENIAYPELKRLQDNSKCRFGIDEDMYDKQATKDFIQKYYVDNNYISSGSLPSGYGVKKYNWTKNYK